MPKPKTPGTKWNTLSKLIQAYADAQEVDSWKGGGDPEDYELKEARLNLARLELNAHMAKMRRDEE